MGKKPTPEALKALREKHDISQAKVAQLLYITLRQVQYYEAGKTPIPQAYWELLKIKLSKRHRYHAKK